MRYFIAGILLCISSHSKAQNLNNTEWIQINVTNRGERTIADNSTLKFLFKGDSLLRSDEEQYSFRQTYQISNKVLLIGNSTKFKIDSLSDVMLVITDIPEIRKDNKALKTRTFIKADYIYDYAKQTDQLVINPGGIVQSNQYFTPTYDGDFQKMFISKFDLRETEKTILCGFLILPDESISNIKVTSDKPLSQEVIDKIKGIVVGTKGSWILPPAPDSLQYQMNLQINISSFFGRQGYSFDFHPIINNGKPNAVLTSQQQSIENEDFDRGVMTMKRKNYEKAIILFQKCLAINPGDTDVYYNLAYCYQQKGNLELACETWKKLKDMGQKDAEKLYDKNCISSKGPSQ